MEGLPLSKDILNHILNMFPEYLKRLLRLVCKNWRVFIKVQSEIKIKRNDIIEDIIKHDY